MNLPPHSRRLIASCEYPSGEPWQKSLESLRSFESLFIGMDIDRLHDPTRLLSSYPAGPATRITDSSAIPSPILSAVLSAIASATAEALATAQALAKAEAWATAQALAQAGPSAPSAENIQQAFMNWPRDWLGAQNKVWLFNRLGVELRLTNIMKYQRIDRRRFLQTSLAGSAVALAGAALSGQALGAVTKPQRDPYDGLKLGIASYSFRSFTLDQALDMTRQTGLKYINLKDVHLALKSSAEQCQEARRKVEAAGLKLMGGGVITIKNDETQIQRIFEYARDAGMPVIVCSPVPEALDAVEKMAKQFGIVIAIHNHGPTDKLYPSPMDVLKMIKDRDALMGICMDVGHTVRIGVDPVECIEQCGDRLHDMHIKDVTEATPKGKNIQVGRGVIDIVAIFKALAARKFAYHIGLEYEADADNPMPGVLESVGYMRGVLAAT